MGGAAEGFDYVRRADGTVVITHRGRVAATLRGGRAHTFLAEVGVASTRGGAVDEEPAHDDAADGPAEADIQVVMARWTGNYRRGNERMARQHPRNRG